MSSIDNLLRHLNAIDVVVDFSNTNLGKYPSAVMDLSLRGAAIQGLAAFEEFVRARGSEWVSALTAARIQATSLPGGPNPYSTMILKTLPRRFQDSSDAERSGLISGLAETLASFSQGALVGHELFFSWSGSNVQTLDIEKMITLVGVPKGWGELTSLWKRLDTHVPPNASAESLMKEFSNVRHSVAHNVNASLAPLAVQSLTRNVKLTAMLFDLLVSQALSQICKGNKVGTQLASSIKVRKLTRDGTHWSDYGPGMTRARRRHKTLSSALTDSSALSAARGEVIVAYDGAEIVDWRSAL